MTAATREPLRLAPAPRPGRARARARRASFAWVAAATLAAILAIVWWRSSGREGMRSVPPDERVALLSRTVQELRQYCGAGRPAALDEHCRELATFAARFPECRGDCDELVRPWLTPVPTR